MTKLPWTKEKIIAAVEAEVEPDAPGKVSIKPLSRHAFERLTQGKDNLSSAQKGCLSHLLASVERAINSRGDLSAAFDEALVSFEREQKAAEHSIRKK
jgi:hypothetical protein